MNGISSASLIPAPPSPSPRRSFDSSTSSRDANSKLGSSPGTFATPYAARTRSNSGDISFARRNAQTQGALGGHLSMGSQDYSNGASSINYQNESSTPPLGGTGAANRVSAHGKTASWLNALSDGLSWIEVQGGQVVAQAANGGLGETLRGGLAGAGAAVAKRPLSFSGLKAVGRRSVDLSFNSSKEAGWLGGTQSRRSSQDTETYNEYDSTSFALPPSVTTQNADRGTLAGSQEFEPKYKPRSRPSSFLGSDHNNNGSLAIDTNSNGASSSNTATPIAPRPISALENSRSYDFPSRPSSSQSTDHHREALTARRTFGTLARPTTLSSTVSSPPATSSNESHRNSAADGREIRRPPQPSNLNRLQRPAIERSSEVEVPSRTSSRGGVQSSQSDFSSETAASTTRQNAPLSTTDITDLRRLSHSGTSSPAPQNTNNSGRTFSFGTIMNSSQPMRRGQSSASTAGSVKDAPAGVSRSSSRTAMTPYRPGFQPFGVKHDRTPEYVSSRAAVLQEKMKEEGRLSRRWGKVPSSEGKAAPSSMSRSSSLVSRISEKRRSLLSMQNITASLDNVRARDVWRGIRSVSGVGVDAVAQEKKREAEMGIVRWEQDSEVKNCRICGSAFSLANRKHHCRLCGRIVCSLPPTSTAVLEMAEFPASPSRMSSALPDEGGLPNMNPRTGLPVGIRREKCSFLLVADWKTGRGEVVDDDFVGWLTMGKVTEGKDEQPKEVMIKGVRSCKECWATVSRKQRIQDRRRPTAFARTYEALKTIESEIIDALPELQDLMLNITSSDDHGGIPSDVISLHKHLVKLFHQYDTAAKRIQSFPAEADSAQDRLQRGIAVSAATFVAKEGAVLQVLPRIQRQKHRRAPTSSSIASGRSIPQTIPEHGGGAPREAEDGTVPGFASRIGIEEQVAIQLQPLLEQEAQIEEYLRAANQQRKFEDAKTLKASLEEIREEIARLAAV